MTIQSPIYGAGFVPGDDAGRVKLFSSAIYARELAESKLREALAREAALLEALARTEATVGQLNEASRKLAAWRASAGARIARLTPREREIMELIVAGQLGKNIAADLGISRRTVEHHRAAIMKRTGAKCFPTLVRLALAAAWTDVPDMSP